MDSNEDKLFDLEALEEPQVEESTGVYRWGAYANGPDAYVQSFRDHPLGAPAQPPVVEEPKPQPEGPVCPCCGNAINPEMIFCPECGKQLILN